MPREIKQNGLPGERCDLSDIFSILPGKQESQVSSWSSDSSIASDVSREAVGDQFRRMLRWIESVKGTHNEIPVMTSAEYVGPVMKVEDYFSVQSIGRGQYVIHINNRLDCQLVEGVMAAIKIDIHGHGVATVQPQMSVAKGDRAD